MKENAEKRFARKVVEQCKTPERILHYIATEPLELSHDKLANQAIINKYLCTLMIERL